VTLPAGISIRAEAPGDEAAIRNLHDRAFGGTVEGRIVDEVRGSDAWLPDLSLVALDDARGQIVGHVLACRGRLERADAPARGVLVLGPIGVLPDRQSEGIGSALMRRSIGAAVRRAEPVIALVGHVEYYPRFGFEPGRGLGIEPPSAAWPDANWMVLRLPAWTTDLRGTVHFPAAYPRD
jgi:putative acetyltransferase